MKKETCYKGFHTGMVCKNKIYKENTTFVEDNARICECGMHYCKNPFDVLDHYGFIDEGCNINEFANVYPEDIEKTDDGKKFCTKKLKVGAKIGIAGLVNAFVNIVINKETSSGNFAQIGSSGDFAKIGSSGDRAKIGSSGDSAKIGSSGDSAKIGSSGNCAQIGSSGNCAQIGSSGNFAQIGSSGDFAKIGSSGDFAKIGSSGDSAKIGSSGDRAKINSKGNGAVIMCAGRGCIASAKKGSWITLSEYEGGVIKCVKTEYVDGERIKEDTFYKLKNGEFVNADEDI